MKRRVVMKRLAARFLLLFCFGCLVFMAPRTGPAAPPDFMMQAEVHGERVEGKPIYWSDNRVQMMLRDGQLLDFSAADARNYRRSAERFRPYSAGELRGRLAAEFGPEFDVTGTGHYLVVHPKGQKDRWAARFEDLYRSFVHYFSVRGLRMKEPEFPLVAVVWKNKQQYQNYAAQHGVPVGSNVVGYYSPLTNRVHLYDATVGNSGNWQENANTLIHEVTHQTAFNTGVHTRFAGCPRWVAEGLGTLFEARGIYNSRDYPNQADRINRGRLAEFRQLTRQGLAPGYLAELVASDRPFDRDPMRAYAVSWAFTFYLVETQPRRYADYLALTASHQAGQKYPEPARLADFTRIFGDNFAMLQARFLRYMAGIK